MHLSDEIETYWALEAQDFLTSGIISKIYSLLMRSSAVKIKFLDDLNISDIFSSQ